MEERELLLVAGEPRPKPVPVKSVWVDRELNKRAHQHDVLPQLFCSDVTKEYDTRPACVSVQEPCLAHKMARIL